PLVPHAGRLGRRGPDSSRPARTRGGRSANGGADLDSRGADFPFSKIRADKRARHGGGAFARGGRASGRCGPTDKSTDDEATGLIPIERIMIDLTGRVALVTGSSRGMGRACALRLAQAGADIIVNYVTSKTAAMETAQQIMDMGRR